jgi:hypothetical protein
VHPVGDDLVRAELRERDQRRLAQHLPFDSSGMPVDDVRLQPASTVAGLAIADLRADARAPGTYVSEVSYPLTVSRVDFRVSAEDSPSVENIIFDVAPEAGDVRLVFLEEVGGREHDHPLYAVFHYGVVDVLLGMPQEDKMGHATITSRIPHLSRSI